MVGWEQVEPARTPRTKPLSQNKRSLAHIAYLVTILIKGFFGLLEFTGGVRGLYEKKH